MPQQIAFFDFDGTITTKDSLLELARFHKGPFGYAKGMIILSPTLLAFKLGIVDAKKAKEKFIRFFFAGMPVQNFEALCSKFSSQKLGALLRAEALKKIDWHKRQGHEIAVVSASAQYWVAPFCKMHELKWITTQLEIKNNCISRNLSGENCNGLQKALRIREAYNLSEFEKIYAYGDSSGDKEMLALATEPFFRQF